MSPTHPAHLRGQASETQASSALGAAHPRRPVLTPLEVAVGEAVFRYQLQQPLADAPQPAHYYLALQGRDPEAAVLHRLQRLGPAVHPFSRCQVTARIPVPSHTLGALGSRPTSTQEAFGRVLSSLARTEAGWRAGDAPSVLRWAETE